MAAIWSFFNSPPATTKTELILVWCSFSGLLTVLFPTHTPSYFEVVHFIVLTFTQVKPIHLYNCSAFLFFLCLLSSQSSELCLPVSQILKGRTAPGHALPYPANPFSLYSSPKPIPFSSDFGKNYVRYLEGGKKQQKTNKHITTKPFWFLSFIC